MFLQLPRLPAATRKNVVKMRQPVKEPDVVKTNTVVNPKS
jgi:hypothetical protein